MRLRAQLVVVPCVTFAARARLALSSGALTPIETIALRAIGLGIDEIGGLTQVVGLGIRPVLDLIYDFWLKGYVLIDSSQGRVRLAGDAAKAFDEGKVEDLGTAENNVTVVPLMQDMVSGAILPHVGRPYPPGPESAMVPALRVGLDLAGIPRAELLDAVQREVRRQSRKEGRDLVVQEAWIEPAQVISMEAAEGQGFRQQRRFLPVWTDIERDPDSGRLLFNVIEAPDLDQPLRQRLGRSLALLNERMAENLFFKRLRQEFERGPAGRRPDDVEAPIERLLRATADLKDTDRGVVEQRHLELSQLRDDGCQQLREAMRSEASVRVVCGYQDHEREVRGLIERAERQLVIANPWLKMQAIVTPAPGAEASWYDLLDRALARGVQVFLLWGIGADDTLDASVANALTTLAKNNQNRLIFSRRSSNVHAKFVLRDAHEALVTSFNFLDPSGLRGNFEMGLSISGVKPGVAPEAVLDLLEWSRGWFPDYVAARRMLLLPAELGADELELPALPASPELPAAGTTVPMTGAQAPAVLYWADSWAAVSKQLADLQRVHGRTVRLIVDREHRDELWRALRMSQARLAVLSDRVSVDVVGDRFIRTLKTRLDAGVACTFLFRREGATDRDAGPAERLRLEAHRLPNLCRLVEAESHAKALVSDEDVIVGSFNFLSYGGDYATARRERAELSFHVHDRKIATQVLTLLEARWSGGFADLASRTLPDPAPVAVRLPPRLQPLFVALIQDPQQRGRTFLEWFGKAKAPWEDVETLERAGLPEDALEQAVAAVLACVSSFDTDVARRWRSRLALAAWRRQDFVGAALLLPRQDEEGGTLPLWLAELGAAVSAEPRHIPPAISETSAMSRSHATAALGLLLVAALVHGNFDLLGSLDDLAQQLGGRPGTWARAARNYFDTAFQPLPLSLLLRSLDQQDQLLESAKARDGLRDALARAEAIGFRFPIGEHTWDLLKKEGYLLGELRRACDADDPARLSRYLASVDAAGTSVEQLMDEASLEVRDAHNVRIELPKRAPCLARLESATGAGRAWLALAQRQVLDATEARVLDACRPLRLALGDLQLEAGAPLDPIADAAFEYARARLAPLLRTVSP